ncbi:MULTISPECIES: aldo/keto reductase [Actinomadura]|uniref:Aldo/keto reductase n=1 Tax=Actinomadura yumaensis TaxID=111807 RepID=A0ABW2CJM6_9ACTN|nr:aldo/keto reductase [Actinomadura sp. J1-007]MWK38824.1 aldo/keto reductase [Actinomadura sp. J1-007]
MSILEETYTLSNGVEIPRIGLGTWFIDDDKVAGAVRAAVETGYRNIDTAQAYGNERGVGEGVRTASVPYAEGNRQAWRALEDAHKAGKLRSIGVSNFLQEDLENILASGTVAPHVNQLLVHVGNTPSDLISYCESKGILVEAYSPIAHGEMLKNQDVAAMAEKYGVTVPQLCIRYTLQLGTVSLPKTADPDHMRSNAEVDFEISEADMAALQRLEARDYGEHSEFPVYSGK